MPRPSTAVRTIATALLCAPALAQPGGGPLDANPLQRAASPCIAPHEYEEIERRIDAFLDANPALAESLAATPRGGEIVFPFYPQAGTLYRDVFVNNFVDLDPTSGLLDWNCRDHTYNGHNGIDSDLRSFGEQEIGVPIYAALDGVVLDTNDGEPDMQTTAPNVLSNYVILDHGGGYRTWYLHMKNGSVAVSPGDFVVAGQQLGLTASSGRSTGPHLHFETRHNNVPIEPWAGDCRTGESFWVNQTPMNLDLHARDMGVTQVDLFQAPPEQLLPYEVPRDPQALTNGDRVYFWILFQNLPADSVWTVVIRREDGAIVANFGSGGFGAQPQPFYRWSWWWWWYTPAFNAAEETHRFQMTVNGEMLIDAPFEVRDEYDPGLNRSPTPFTVALDPPAPTPDDVVFCRVDHDLLLDDPDYDIVRYEYRWTVDGEPVRTVTNAAHSDAIRRNIASMGQTLACEVTALDGKGGSHGPLTAQFTMTDPATPPAPFDLTAPAAGAVNAPLAPLLSWTPTEPAAQYRVRIAKDPDLIDTVYEAVVPASQTQHQLPAGILDAAARYWWGVTAENFSVQTLSSPSARTFATLLPGDANGDGVVGFSDLNIVIALFGQSGAGLDGDVDGDQFVGFSDLNAVLVYFGFAVPE